jgi:hypothetical protein
LVVLAVEPQAVTNLVVSGRIAPSIYPGRKPRGARFTREDLRTEAVIICGRILFFTVEQSVELFVNLRDI